MISRGIKMKEQRSLLEKIAYFFEDSANARTAQELYALTDEQLENLGISRDKLKQGAAAWPWKVDKTESATVHSHDFTQETSESTGHDDHTPLAA